MQATRSALMPARAGGAAAVPLPLPAAAGRPAAAAALVRAAKQQQKQQQKQKQQAVSYGADWYESTRNATKRFRTVKEEIEYRREANRAANNGRERKDLYTANWDGDQYKGSRWNVLTVIALISVLTPLAGLIFAYQSFGVLWG